MFARPAGRALPTSGQHTHIYRTHAKSHPFAARGMHARAGIHKTNPSAYTACCKQRKSPTLSSIRGEDGVCKAVARIDLLGTSANDFTQRIAVLPFGFLFASGVRVHAFLPHALWYHRGCGRRMLHGCSVRHGADGERTRVRKARVNWHRRHRGRR